ncbi:MFS transporter [Pseudomonas syringae]|nr:MFS transporter [Pseudomonas syringae]
MATSDRVDVSAFLDSQPIGIRQWLIFGLCLVVLGIDGFDTTSIGFIAPALIDDWGIRRQDLGPVMMSGLFGVAVGCIIAGPLADKFGRRVVVIGSVAFIGVWSLVSAYSGDVISLSVFRFLTGLGLGASMPNAATLVSECAPTRRRSQMVTSIYSGFAVGAALGGLASESLIANFGWRSVLIVGGVIPLAFSIVLLVWLPESIAFMVHRKQEFAARLVKTVNALCPGVANESTTFYTSEDSVKGKGSVRALFSRNYYKGTLLIWLILFMGLINLYLLSSWLPLLSRDAGLTLAQAAIIGALFQAGGVFGNLAIGIKMDRWNHHKVVALTILGGALTAFLIALNNPTVFILYPTVMILGYFVNSANAGAYALAAHFYPSQFRATGVSWATAVGRIGAISGAGIGASMLAMGWGFRELFFFVSVPALIGASAVLLKKYTLRTVPALVAT